ncbi:MAG: hypothetical protein ACI9G1_000678, partial [Pirellulaceae bacterium]
RVASSLAQQRNYSKKNVGSNDRLKGLASIGRGAPENGALVNTAAVF